MAVVSLLVSLPAYAGNHEHEGHKHNGHQSMPEKCEDMKSMSHSNMDMNDPELQEMVKKCRHHQKHDHGMHEGEHKCDSMHSDKKEHKKHEHH